VGNRWATQPAETGRDFASLYLAYGSKHDWSNSLTQVDAVFVALGTLTTAGTSGISAKSEAARALVASQMAVGIIVTMVIFGLLVAVAGERSSRS
jgi:hypothetical protein